MRSDYAPLPRRTALAANTTESDPEPLPPSTATRRARLVLLSGWPGLAAAESYQRLGPSSAAQARSPIESSPAAWPNLPRPRKALRRRRRRREEALRGEGMQRSAPTARLPRARRAGQARHARGLKP